MPIILLILGIDIGEWIAQQSLVVQILCGIVMMLVLSFIVWLVWKF